jgi:putative restriction endonuclease
MLGHLNYSHKLNPKGQFCRIADTKLSGYGGVQGYVRHLLENYPIGNQTNPFAPISSDEETDVLRFVSASDLPILNLAIQNWATTMESLADPPLTQPNETTIQEVKTRNATFALIVKRLYDYKCAICSTGLISPQGHHEVQAAHVFPKSKNGSDDPRNGLCLCRRHHWAFDEGCIAITDKYTVQVHPNVPRTGEYAFIWSYDTKPIQLPQEDRYKPHIKFIREHRKLFDVDNAFTSG